MHCYFYGTSTICTVIVTSQLSYTIQREIKSWKQIQFCNCSWNSFADRGDPETTTSLTGNKINFSCMCSYSFTLNTQNRLENPKVVTYHVLNFKKQHGTVSKDIYDCEWNTSGSTSPLAATSFLCEVIKWKIVRNCWFYWIPLELRLRKRFCIGEYIKSSPHLEMCFQCLSPTSHFFLPLQIIILHYYWHWTFSSHQMEAWPMLSTYLLRWRQGPLTGDTVFQVSWIPCATGAADYFLLENKDQKTHYSLRKQLCKEIIKQSFQSASYPILTLRPWNWIGLEMITT